MSEDRPAGGPEPKPETMTVAFKAPFVMPGTPEAHRHGCLCNFERNLHASIIAAERYEDTTIVVIHKDCPLHQIVRATDDPECE